MLAIVTSLLFAVQQLPITTIKANYHDRLIERCEEVAGRACCRASVHAMREEQARLYVKEKGCPQGAQPISLRCPASFTWCSFNPPDYKNPFEVYE